MSKLINYLASSRCMLHLASLNLIAYIINNNTVSGLMTLFCLINYFFRNSRENLDNK